MKNISTSTALLLSLIVLSSGCAKRSRLDEMSLGIENDGKLFWDWKGIAAYNTQQNGTLFDNDGVRIKASFGHNLSDMTDLVFELTAQIDTNDNYTVLGTAICKKNATLVLLGTEDNEDQDRRIELTRGTNTIEYSGGLPFTYKKE